MSLKEHNMALPNEMDGVAREDSASKAAGHLHSRDLVDDKIGKHHGLTMLVTPCFPASSLTSHYIWVVGIAWYPSQLCSLTTALCAHRHKPKRCQEGLEWWRRQLV